jgi:hypothetical protein
VTPLPILLGLCPIAITICYILLCAASPWGTCSRCHGRSRTCQRCDATGMRPRLGWQLYARARATWRDATR